MSRDADGSSGGVTRRAALRSGLGVVAGGALVAGGRSLTAAPPKLTHGFFNVDPDAATTTTPDVQFALVTESPVSDSQAETVVDNLTVDADAATVERQAQTLQFFERFKSENVPDRIRDEVERRQGTEALDHLEKRFNDPGALSDDVDPGRIVRGVVRDGFERPPVDLRFSGAASAVPAVTYYGPAADISKKHRFVFQTHDGYMHRFPKQNPEYPLDARYDIEPNNKLAHEVPDRGYTNTRRFVDDPPSAVSRGSGESALVPGYSYRAHPSLATLESIAKRRTVALLQVGFGVREETQQLDEFIQEVDGVTKDTVLKPLTIIGGTPPSGPLGFLKSTSLALAPVAATATPALLAQLGWISAGTAIAAAPVAGAVVGAILSAYAFAQAFTATFDFAETLADEIFARFDASQIQNVFLDPSCSPNLDDSPQCGTPGGNVASKLSTPLAAGELSKLVYRYGPKTLGNGTHDNPQFDRNLETYRVLSAEIEQQADGLESRDDNQQIDDTLKQLIGTLTDVVDVTKTEQVLLDGLESDFERPVPLPTFETAPADPDGDGTYEDVNGDGHVDVNDVQALDAYRDSEAVTNHPAAFDFDGSDEVTERDVDALFEEVSR
jgi:PKD repeat protein